jgi:hypothetical protein
MKRIMRSGAVLLVVGMLASMLLTGSSLATNTICLYDDPNDQVTMSIAFAPNVRLFVTQSGDFMWEDTQTNTVSDCGAATVMNTNSVDVVDFTNPEATPKVVLDFRRPWPGMTLEKNGVSEIEIDYEDQRDHPETLMLLGRNGSDSYVAGAMGFNLNGDNDGDDIEITVNQIEELYIKGRDDADLISVRGGAETGGPFVTDSVTLQGDSGHDFLLGSLGSENLRGLDGDDDMLGGPAADQLSGDDGADLMRGGRGGDELFGMKGSDRLRGLRGADDLEGGPADDNLNGGRGIDSCVGGPGMDSFNNCEG